MREKGETRRVEWNGEKDGGREGRYQRREKVMRQTTVSKTDGNKEKDRDHEKGAEGHREEESETRRSRDRPRDVMKGGGSGCTPEGGTHPMVLSERMGALGLADGAAG